MSWVIEFSIVASSGLNILVLSRISAFNWSSVFIFYVFMILIPVIYMVISLSLSTCTSISSSVYYCTFFVENWFTLCLLALKLRLSFTISFGSSNPRLILIFSRCLNTGEFVSFWRIWIFGWQRQCSADFRASSDISSSSCIAWYSISSRSLKRQMILVWMTFAISLWRRAVKVVRISV